LVNVSCPPGSASSLSEVAAPVVAGAAVVEVAGAVLAEVAGLALAGVDGGVLLLEELPQPASTSTRSISAGAARLGRLCDSAAAWVSLTVGSSYVGVLAC
jgi:hypothetical protein